MRLFGYLPVAALAACATALNIRQENCDKDLGVEDDEKYSGPLGIQLAATGNSEIKITLTNNGPKPLSLVNVGSLLDEARPVEKVTMYSAKDNKKLPFEGVHVHLREEGLASEDFVTLAPGGKKELKVETTSIYTLNQGGRFNVVAKGGIRYAEKGSVKPVGILYYESNKLTMDIDGRKASKMARPMDKRQEIDSTCSPLQAERLREGFENCARFATNAAKEAHKGTKLKEYFKRDDSCMRKFIGLRYELIATECAENAKHKTRAGCAEVTNKLGGCRENTYALTNVLTSKVTYCPKFFDDTPPVTSYCWYADQATTIIHELTHAPSIFSYLYYTGDYAYDSNMDAVMGLGKWKARNNADTYALYANAIRLNCPEYRPKLWMDQRQNYRSERLMARYEWNSLTSATSPTKRQNTDSCEKEALKAKDIEDQKSPLGVKLAAVSNTKVKITLSNNGKTALNLLSLGTVLDDKNPVKTLTVYPTGGSEPLQFEGVVLRLAMEALSQDAFTTLAAGAKKEITVDFAAIYTLKTGKFDVVAEGSIPFAEEGSAIITDALNYKSNRVTINIDGNQAAKVPKPFSKRTLITDSCTGTQRKIVETALRNCATLAGNAAKSARAGLKMDEHFGNSRGCTKDAVAKRFEAVASECATAPGKTKTKCLDSTGLCAKSPYTVAFAVPATKVITLCPRFFRTAPRTSQCHELDQATTLLHEMTHVPAVRSPYTGDYGYQSDAYMLPWYKALFNADSYAMYANSIDLNCPPFDKEWYKSYKKTLRAAERQGRRPNQKKDISSGPVDVVKPANSLSVNLAAAGNSKVKITVVNVGFKALNVLKVGTLLDETAPVMHVSMYFANNGTKVPFQGITYQLKPNLQASSFTTLAAGAKKEMTIDIADIYDLQAGGKFYVIAQDALPYSGDKTTILLGKVNYESNKLLMDIEATHAPKIHTIMSKRSVIEATCDVKERKALENAQAQCVKLSTAAAKAARAGTNLDKYFLDSSSATKKKVSNVFSAAAKECSSSSKVTTSRCNDPLGYCDLNPDMLAYAKSDRKYVNYCPEFFKMVVLPVTCFGDDMATTTLHELTHLSAVSDPVTRDHAYQKDVFSYQKIKNSAMALENADTYAMYAQGIYMNCPLPAGAWNPAHLNARATIAAGDEDACEKEAGEVKYDSTLSVNIAAASNSKVKVTVVNNGKKTLNLFQPGTVLDDQSPVQKVSMSFAENGTEVPFEGFSFHFAMDKLKPSSFLSLAPGAKKEFTVETANVYNLERGGKFNVFSTGTIPYAKEGSTSIYGSLTYKSNQITMNIDGAQAAKVPKLRPNNKRTIIDESTCSAAQIATLKEGFSNCEKMATAAAKDVSKGKYIQEYFRSPSSCMRRKISNRFSKVAADCSLRSRKTKTVCNNPLNYCVYRGENVLAYTDKRTNIINYCPKFWETPALPRPTLNGCWKDNQVSVIIHEETHAPAIVRSPTEDFAKMEGVFMIGKAKAWQNADNYGAYAVANYLNCNATEKVKALKEYYDDEMFDYP